MSAETGEPLHRIAYHIPQFSKLLRSILKAVLHRIPTQLHQSVAYLDQTVLEKLAKLENDLDTTSDYRLLHFLSRQLRIPPIYFTIAGLGAVLAVSRWLIRLAIRILIDLIGITYPTIKTLEGSESSANMTESDRRQDEVQWRSYWLLFASVKFVDHFREAKKAIPFYSGMKLALLLWAMNPESKGATVLYHRFFKPLYESHHEHTFLKQIKSFFDNYSVKRLFSSGTSEDNPNSDNIETPQVLSATEQTEKLSHQSVSLPSSPQKYQQQKRRSLAGVGVGAREPLAANSLFIHGLITNSADSSPSLARKNVQAKDTLADRRSFEEFLRHVGTKNINAENLDVA